MCPDGLTTAVCNHEMRYGKHYATFTIHEPHEDPDDPDDDWNASMGVVGPDFQPSKAPWPCLACQSPQGWVLSTDAVAHDGANFPDGAPFYHGRGRMSNWVGQPERVNQGDVVVRTQPFRQPNSSLRLHGCLLRRGWNSIATPQRATARHLASLFSARFLTRRGSHGAGSRCGSTASGRGS